MSFAASRAGPLPTPPGRTWRGGRGSIPLGGLAAKYPQATANFDVASDWFAQEARALAAAKELRATMEDEPSEEQRIRMAGLLSQARAMYALAIDEVGRTLRKIGGPRSDQTG